MLPFKLLFSLSYKVTPRLSLPPVCRSTDQYYYSIFSLISIVLETYSPHTAYKYHMTDELTLF